MDPITGFLGWLFGVFSALSGATNAAGGNAGLGTAVVGLLLLISVAAIVIGLLRGSVGSVALGVILLLALPLLAPVASAAAAFIASPSGSPVPSPGGWGAELFAVYADGTNHSLTRTGYLPHALTALWAGPRAEPVDHFTIVVYHPYSEGELIYGVRVVGYMNESVELYSAQLRRLPSGRPELIQIPASELLARINERFIGMGWLPPIPWLPIPWLQDNSPDQLLIYADFVVTVKRPGVVGALGEATLAELRLTRIPMRAVSEAAETDGGDDYAGRHYTEEEIYQMKNQLVVRCENGEILTAERIEQLREDANDPMNPYRAIYAEIVEAWDEGDTSRACQLYVNAFFRHQLIPEPLRADLEDILTLLKIGAAAIVIYAYVRRRR